MNTKARILALLTAGGLLCGPSPVIAQPPPPHNAETTYYGADPSGTCSTGRQWVNTATNHFWNCKNGGWVDLTSVAGVTWPLLAPAGTINAPSYSFSGFAEMGMNRIGTTLLLQNKGTTSTLGRSRLSLGEENFSLLATRSENAAHTGALQCFDEGGGTMICRFDVTDGTNLGSYKFLPTLATFDKELRIGAATEHLIRFLPVVASGTPRTLTITTEQITGAFGKTVTIPNIAGKFLMNAASNIATSPISFEVTEGGQLTTYSFGSGASNGWYIGTSGSTEGGYVWNWRDRGSDVPFQFIGSGTYAGKSIAWGYDLNNGANSVAQQSFSANDGVHASSVEINSNGPADNTFTGSKPTCEAATRRHRWYVEGGAGVADTYEVCAKSSLDTYAWYPLATIP